ncbi:MAG: hypothetical protein FWC19_06500 [Treponema sp.]|nr:hypothetical protein [Treponema sp.]MCL2272434.1 hypothetical protein [Treponema sp.]
MTSENILRGTLLDFLRKVYPEGAGYQSILSVFFQYHKIDAISASLEYLADKAYIKKIEQPHPYIQHEKLMWYKITPHGIDLNDGTIPSDPGILLQRS